MNDSLEFLSIYLLFECTCLEELEAKTAIMIGWQDFSLITKRVPGRVSQPAIHNFMQANGSKVQVESFAFEK